MRPTSRCPRHPNVNLIEDHHAGDVICPECGFVVTERVVDVGSEWRTFQNDSNSKNNSRVGDKENPLLGDMNLSTMIMPVKGDNSLALKSKYIGSHEDKVMFYAFKQINAISDRLNLPRLIIDQACLFFKQAYVSKTFKIKRTEAVIAGAIYIACRCEGVPRTLKELCAVSGVSKVDIGRMFKKIKHLMASNVKAISPDSYIERFGSNLELSRPIIILARKICLQIEDLNLVTGRSPLSIAAVAISIASVLERHQHFNLRKIAEDCGVTDSTIKIVFKALRPNLPQIISEDKRASHAYQNIDAYFI